jgi:hypothetical protein
LGLTRFEIPIDSRITSGLNGHGFPLKLFAANLSNKYYYEFMMDGVHLLRQNCDILPCMFDAAVFSNVDMEEGVTIWHKI